jgi:hypothetical protein
MKRYNVWLRSRPGFYAQYDGKVTVWADDEDDAVEMAMHKLKTGAFSDRDNSMWIVEKVERVHEKAASY